MRYVIAMNCAILLAAGSGKRFKGEKLFALLNGQSVILHSLKFLQHAKEVDDIVVVTRPALVSKIKRLIKKEHITKVKTICNGGATRYASVAAGVAKSNPLASLFIVHNGVNPLASTQELSACVRGIRGKTMGTAAGRPLYSSLKRVSDSRVVAAIDRSGAWEMETPQVVHAKEFRALISKFPPSKYTFTDELAVLEQAGLKAAVILASHENRKITTPHDLVDWSVGIGEDSHRFMPRQNKATNKPFVLGGISFPKIHALDANSDGDVLLHAICNAISSAIGKGSLGTYATELHLQGEQNSAAYLAHIIERMQRARYRLYHLAISFEAAVPKIDPLVPRLKKNLQKLLGVSEARIGITATSGEDLTSFGRGEGIACRTVVLLKKI